jgi:peptidoglycan/LPS O-acetylase OafA/YrhL
MVVVDHALLRQAGWTDFSPAAQMAAHNLGALGVTVFFIISGFIMFHTAGHSFGRPGAALIFLRKRILRIVPLYWTATLLEAVLRLHKGGAVSPHELVASLLFIPLPVPLGEHMQPLLGVGWTLNYEMFFYCLFALALFLRRPVGLVLLFSALCGLVAIGTVYKPFSDASPPHDLVTFWTDPVILLFAVGVQLGLLAEEANKSVPRRVALVIGGIALLAGASSSFWLGGSLPAPRAWQLAVWALSALAVGVCIFAKPSAPGIATQVGVHLGDISYALYLFHFFAIVVAEKLWWLLFAKSQSVFFVPAAYLVSVVAAFAIHHLFELSVKKRPTRGARAKQRRLRRIRIIPMTPNGSRPA